MARKPLPYVPPEKFAEVRDKAGAKNIELARALGVSPTRVTELTRTKGGTARQLARVREAIAAIRKQRQDARRDGMSSSRSSGRSRGPRSMQPA